MCHYHFWTNRSKIKVTWVIPIFACVCSMACCVYLWEAAYRNICDVEINEMFAFPVRRGGTEIVSRSTINNEPALLQILV